MAAHAASGHAVSSGGINLQLSTEVTSAVERLNTRVKLNLDELYKQMAELKDNYAAERKHVRICITR